MTKRNDLLSMVGKGWVSIDALAGQLGWQHHTIRGALSTLGKAYPIERKRENGQSYYRVKPEEVAA